MTEKGKKEAGTSMVAPSPTGKEGLRPVEELATERGYQPWYLAGLRWAAGRSNDSSGGPRAAARSNQRRQQP
jgi:hypothetical protein